MTDGLDRLGPEEDGQAEGFSASTVVLERRAYVAEELGV
jgi:hypothetical protein